MSECLSCRWVRKKVSVTFRMEVIFPLETWWRNLTSWLLFYLDPLGSCMQVGCMIFFPTKIMEHGLHINTLSVKRNLNHFFRATLTKIHAIKINNIWTQISFNTPNKNIWKTQDFLVSKKEKNAVKSRKVIFWKSQKLLTEWAPRRQPIQNIQ